MVRWQTVAKLLGGGSIGLISLFAYLFLLTGISYTYTGDSVCDKLVCEAYINVSTTYWRTCFEHTKETQKVYLSYNSVYGGSNEKLTPFIYNELESQPVLYKKSTRGRTLWVNLNKVDNIISTEPPISVDWLVPARGKGNWRNIKDGDCWDRLKTNKIKLVGYPKEAQVIKWSFELGEVSIDPIFISWDFTYEKLSKKEKVYDYTTVQKEIKCDAKNLSCTKSIFYNETTRTLLGYKTVYYKGERVGLKVGNLTYDKNTNIDKEDYLYHCIVDLGDRNWDRYPYRQYEMDKRICTRTKVLDLI